MGGCIGLSVLFLVCLGQELIVNPYAIGLLSRVWGLSKLIHT